MFDFDVLANAIPRQTVLCIGDLMHDEFVYGEVSRISPEAPAPVILITYETTEAAVRAALEGGGGAIRAATSARAGVADQDLGQIDLDRSPHAILADRFRLGDQSIRAALAGAGVAIDRQTTPARRLSGGQRSRLAMLLLRLEQPNLYLLDEPTNHLDIEGQEALEDEIAGDSAAALVVSHDRAFVRAVGTRFWQIAGRRLEEVETPEDFFRLAEAGAA